MSELHINHSGWLEGDAGAGLRHVPSPNFDQRPANSRVDLLVIHNISLPPDEFGGDWIVDFFCNRLDAEAHPYFASIAGLRVSSHALIRRDGEIIQFVSFDERAWHAGVSSYQGHEKCNDFSIGIELEGSDHQPFTASQYQQLGKLSRLLIKHYPGLNTERIAGHSDIAPGRKTDPGPFFQWDTFLQQLYS